MSIENARTENPASRKIRYAVVGLGEIAVDAVLPAFFNARENSELTALVTGDKSKAQKLVEKYQVKNIFSYDEYDNLLSSGLIDAVYIALPNTMHKDFTIRAAKAGVHILCEKPMAASEADCQSMIDAARQNGVKLMTAYRLHFEEGNLSAVQRVADGEIGEPKFFSSVFSIQVEEGNTRLQRDLAGGPLYDIGIYCINAARYIFQEDPTEVTAFFASSSDPRFSEVEESVSALMRFSKGKLATFTCSFAASPFSSYEVVGTEGVLRVEPAYDYATDISHTLFKNGNADKKSFQKRDQFAPELIAFSRAILEDQQLEPDGEEGLIDIRIINALQLSAEKKESVTLDIRRKTTRPDLSQNIRKPPAEEASSNASH